MLFDDDDGLDGERLRFCAALRPSGARRRGAAPNLN
jgi:hypothetical protein